MVAAEAAEDHGDEWSLTWYLRWGIYTSNPTWTHSQTLLVAADAGWSYPLMKHLSDDQKDCPNQHENINKLHDETEHPILNLMKSQWKLRQQQHQSFSIEVKSL